MGILKSIFKGQKNPSKASIRKYLDGKMDAGNTRNFEQAISDNPLLGDAIEGFKEFGSSELDAVPSLDDFYHQKSTPSKVRNLRTTINRVAALLLGVVAISAVYIYLGETSNERIYADNFNEFFDPSIYALRGGDDPSKNQLHPTKDKAITYFLDQNYSESIVFWEKYLEIDGNDVQSKMYMGYCLMEEGNTEEAIEYLSAIAGEDSEYKDETRWYLALAQLKVGDTEGARGTLDDLVNNSPEFYVKKAQLILEQL